METLSPHTEQGRGRQPPSQNTAHTSGNNALFNNHIPELSYIVLIQLLTAMEVGFMGKHWWRLPPTVQPGQGLDTQT